MQSLQIVLVTPVFSSLLRDRSENVESKDVIEYNWIFKEYELELKGI